MTGEDAKGSALAELRAQYLKAQLAGDRREAIRVVVEEGLAKGQTVPDLHRHVIGGAQLEIGRLWQLNQVSVAQEHMASAISQLALAQLFQNATPAKPIEKRAVIACVDGEQHELPARLVSDALELAGFDVSFLGASVPTDTLLDFVRDTRPALIGLSVTMSFHLPTARRTVVALRGVTSAPIMVGGHALGWSPEVLADIGVTVVTQADELLPTALRLVGAAA